MNRLRQCAMLCLLALAVASCVGPPEPPEFPPIRFLDGGPIRLGVGRIEVIDEYRPPLTAPNVEHVFPAPPAAAIAQWARDRLRAVGAGGRAKVIIHDASVIEVALKKTTGVRGALTTDQSERYDASIAVEVRIVDGRNRRRGHATVRAKRSRSVPEDITLAGRERVWYAMTVKTMTTVDQALQRRIRETLAVFVR